MQGRYKDVQSVLDTCLRWKLQRDLSGTQLKFGVVEHLNSLDQIACLNPLEYLKPIK